MRSHPITGRYYLGLNASNDAVQPTALKYGIVRRRHEGKASVHRVERRGGSFDRAISLPIQINADAIKAECRDGILALFVPRAEHDKPRAITIS